jgi:hypothetical protein
MSWTPADSAVKVTPELEEKIANSSPEMLRVLLSDAIVDQGLAQKDFYDPQILIPTGIPVPKKFAVTVELPTGKRFVEGDTEAEAQRLAVEAYREAASQRQEIEQPVQSQQPRDYAGRFVTPQAPVDRSELDAKFRRGQIDAETYLEQSGALDRWLDSRGISVTDLQEAANRSYTQSWADGTNSFLHSHPDYPGGVENMRLMGEEIQALGLADASDKAAALARVFEKLKSENRLVANPEMERQREFESRVSQANSHESLRRAAHELYGR